MKDKSNYHDNNLWKGAPNDLFQKAINLRKNQTKAETLLWERLKNNQLNGIKFRRQHPMKLYILDFYCHKYKLGIEIDGEYHLEVKQQKKDATRTEELTKLGIKIIRFTNQEIEQNIDKVIQTIKSHIIHKFPF